MIFLIATAERQLLVRRMNKENRQLAGGRTGSLGKAGRNRDPSPRAA